MHLTYAMQYALYNGTFAHEGAGALVAALGMLKEGCGFLWPSPQNDMGFSTTGATPRPSDAQQ